MSDETKDETTGKPIRTERGFLPRPPRPDDKIFSLGFVIGGIRRNRLPEDEVAAARKRADLQKLAEIVGEEMMDQFKGKE